MNRALASLRRWLGPSTGEAPAGRWIVVDTKPRDSIPNATACSRSVRVAVDDDGIRLDDSLRSS